MTGTATSLSLGLAFVPDLPPERLRALVTTAELAGLDEFWVWEDCFKESGIATAAAALAWTDRIAVGIGLLPVPLRNVALTAMEIATLERLFPGRLRAGVGHGVQDWMQQVGARAASPMTLLEEHARALRALLAGERVTTAGRYVTLDGVALDWPPSPPPPLLLGGTGPRSLALAGRLGGGTLLATAMTEEDVRSSCETVFAARNGARHPVVVTVIVATGHGARERVDREVPRWGRRADEGIGLAGDAEEIAAGLRRLAEFGITSVVVQPTRDEPDLTGLVHLLGREVRPLL